MTERPGDCWGWRRRRPIAVTIDGPMVGRDQELGLTRVPHSTRTRLGGEANLLTVLGEAGIGKSRLAQELGDRLRGRGDGADRSMPLLR